MSQTFDLNKMGLAPMTLIEMQEIDGGGWITDALKALGVEKAAEYVWDHKADIFTWLGETYSTGMPQGASYGAMR